MSYCTIDNIKERIPEKVILDLTQDDKVKTEIDNGRLTAAIFDSDAIIDRKLKNRYVVPLATVPSSLIRVAVDIAIYFLYRARFNNAMPDTVKESYAEALAYLTELQNGIETIDAEVNPTDDFIILTNQSRHDLIYSERTRRRI